jgi:hypothetical protein
MSAAPQYEPGAKPIAVPRRPCFPLTPAMSNPHVVADAFVEAIASLFAAADAVNELAGPDSGQFFVDAGERLKAAVFGPNPESDDAWSTEPVRVEIEASQAEIAADALEAICVPHEVSYRIATLRAMASRYREHGRVNLMFKLAGPVEVV